AGRLADVPRYAWQHERFWPDERPPVPPRAAHAHPLLGPGIRLPGAPVRHIWQTELDTGRLPWLADHQVHGVPVLPGTGYAEMALAAACEAFDTEPARVTVKDLDYRGLLPVGRPVTVTTTLTVTGDGEGELEIVTERNGRPLVQATARLTLASTGASGASGTSAPVAEPPPGRRIPATAVYERLRAMGQFHGPRFAALTDLTVEGDEALAVIRWPDQLPPHPLLRCHPALLDACLHGLAGLLPEGGTGDLLPVGVDRLHLAGDPSTVRFSRARLRETEGGYTADVRVLDADGATVAELDGLRLRPVSGDALPVPVDDLLHT
ncbi:polyketide synthase dehydratase domain-containing protein, partial [Streptomyces sp. W16]|uniref:polyketide synthase dehydratase domain-containing protein n=1 Tax=Streptomyces sp. W16 TaxID=3076631 RepID=UPI00295BFA2C